MSCLFHLFQRSQAAPPPPAPRLPPSPPPPPPPRPTFCIYDSEEEREENRRAAERAPRPSPFPLLDSFGTLGCQMELEFIFCEGKGPAIPSLFQYLWSKIQAQLYLTRIWPPPPPSAPGAPVPPAAPRCRGQPTLTPVHAQRRHLDHGEQLDQVENVDQVEQVEHLKILNKLNRSFTEVPQVQYKDLGPSDVLTLPPLPIMPTSEGRLSTAHTLPYVPQSK